MTNATSLLRISRKPELLRIRLGRATGLDPPSARPYRPRLRILAGLVIAVGASLASSVRASATASRPPVVVSRVWSASHAITWLSPLPPRGIMFALGTRLTPPHPHLPRASTAAEVSPRVPRASRRHPRTGPAPQASRGRPPSATSRSASVFDATRKTRSSWRASRSRRDGRRPPRHAQTRRVSFRAQDDTESGPASLEGRPRQAPVRVGTGSRRSQPALRARHVPRHRHAPRRVRASWGALLIDLCDGGDLLTGAGGRIRRTIRRPRPNLGRSFEEEGGSGRCWKPTSEATAAPMIRGMLRALAACHEHGVVHATSNTNFLFIATAVRVAWLSISASPRHSRRGPNSPNSAARTPTSAPRWRAADPTISKWTRGPRAWWRTCSSRASRP